MKRYLALLLFVTQMGCGGFIEYTIISAGTLTGNILSDQYKDYQEKKEKKDDKNDNK